MQLATDSAGALAHAPQPVTARLRVPGQAGPVVADAQPQGVIAVVEFHVDGGTGRVPPGVGEGFLNDAVGGELGTGVERDRRAGDDRPGGRPRGSPNVNAG